MRALIMVDHFAVGIIDRFAFDANAQSLTKQIKHVLSCAVIKVPTYAATFRKRHILASLFSRCGHDPDSPAFAQTCRRFPNHFNPLLGFPKLAAVGADEALVFFVIISHGPLLHFVSPCG